MDDQNHPLDTGQVLFPEWERQAYIQRVTETRKMVQEFQECLNKALSLLGIEKLRNLVMYQPLRYLLLQHKQILQVDKATITGICLKHFKWYDHVVFEAIHKFVQSDETLSQHTELLAAVKQMEGVVHKYFQDRLIVSDSKAILMMDSEYPSINEGSNEEKLHGWVLKVLGGKKFEIQLFEEGVKETTVVPRDNCGEMATMEKESLEFPLIPPNSECCKCVDDTVRDYSSFEYKPKECFAEVRTP